MRPANSDEKCWRRRTISMLQNSFQKQSWHLSTSWKITPKWCIWRRKSPKWSRRSYNLHTLISVCAFSSLKIGEWSLISQIKSFRTTPPTSRISIVEVLLEKWRKLLTKLFKTSKKLLLSIKKWKDSVLVRSMNADSWRKNKKERAKS